MKARNSELSTRDRAAMLGAIGICLAIVGAAERDIQRRAAAEIRGRKLVWRVAASNVLGALGYFRWGRRGR